MNANKTTDIYLITYNNSENETMFVTSVHSDDITYFIPIHQNAIIKDDVFSEVSKKDGWQSSKINVYGSDYDTICTIKNDNYYCCYKKDKTTYISLVASQIRFKDYFFYLPINYINFIDFTNTYEISKENITTYFNNNTFESTLEYYSGFNSKEINTELKYIIFDCYDMNSKTTIKAMIDFNNNDLKILINDKYVSMLNSTKD